jgi:hypothetical protein
MSSWGNRASAPKRIFKNQAIISPIIPQSEPIKTTESKPLTNLVKQPYTSSNQYDVINGYNHKFLSNNDMASVNIITNLHSTKIPNIKKIVNVYKTSYKGINKSQGFGDFIRGSIFLYQLCKINNIDFDINIKYHPMGKYFKNESVLQDISQDILDDISWSVIDNYLHENKVAMLTYGNLPYHKIRGIITNMVINPLYNELSQMTSIKDNVLYIFNIAFPLFEVNDDDKLFIRERIKLNSTIIDKYNDICLKSSITPKSYQVLHIRTGDKIILGTGLIDYSNKYISRIESQINTNMNTMPLVLISDSSELKKYLSEKYSSIKVIDSEISHLGEYVSLSDNGILDTLTDMEIISNSHNVISLTIYHHGSGFAVWPSLINYIPYSISLIA